MKFPNDIPKPDYANDPQGRSSSEEKLKGSNKIPVYSEEQISGIREASKIARYVLDEAHKLCKEGVRTDEIDKRVFEICVEKNCYPSPLNYYNFPKSVCT
jgi:methionyl aminopeptidase